jgi:hypothetical protein
MNRIQKISLLIGAVFFQVYVQSIAFLIQYGQGGKILENIDKKDCEVNQLKGLTG